MESFPIDFRLREAGEFEAVFKRGEYRASTRHLLCLAIGNSREHPRLGMVVAKRNVNAAVQRNRVKRVIRECFRKNSSTLPHCDIVVICRSGVADLDNRSLDQALLSLWRKLKDNIA